MKVFRLECPEGRGPYRAKCFLTETPDANEIYDLIAENYSVYNNDDCPSATADSMPIPYQYRYAPPPEAKFGCESIKSLARWWRRRWDKLKPALKANAFRVVEYEVPDDSAWAGRHQVMFLGDRAVTKKRLTLRALDKVMPEVLKEP